MFFHSRSRSREFLGMIASDSHSRIVGMDFFIPFPFPNCGNGFFSFPSRSRILGIDFFIPFPFPNFGNGFFSFPSRSRIEGMGFFNSLPVPELREWNYPFPFPFPNSQMSFPLTPGGSRGMEWKGSLLLLLFSFQQQVKDRSLAPKTPNANLRTYFWPGPIQ